MAETARELSAKLFDTRQIQSETPKQEPVPKPAEKEIPSKPKIPQKPVISAEAAAYPKLFKIYKELRRQNEVIFEAEKERRCRRISRKKRLRTKTEGCGNSCKNFINLLTSIRFRTII
ncbi:MAG: hypothetical protein NC126_12185 [Clostridium sp.]|nr:hypothetical protein [Clostridium sp.]